jgi:hypothetical protein
MEKHFKVDLKNEFYDIWWFVDEWNIEYIFDIISSRFT